MTRKPTSGERRTAPKKVAARKVAGRTPKPSPETAEPDPFDTPEKAYAAAVRAIDAARQSHATDLRLPFRRLQSVPHEISIATSVRNLWFDGTNLSDLTALESLHKLRGLVLDFTTVVDLRPLSGLSGLVSLSLNGTIVSDLSPLSRLNRLSHLSLDVTRVTDLTPIAALTSLEVLSLVGTAVVDLAPLAGLNRVSMLSLDGTHVADLGPIASLTSLIDGVQNPRPEIYGLSYNRAAVARKTPFHDFVKLDQPACTVETINYLRRQQGLPEYRPPAAADVPVSPPEMATETPTLPSIPTPRPAAIEPIWRNDRLTLPIDPATADLDQPDLDAALQALKVLLSELAEDASHEGNIDKRMVAYLRRTADKITDTAPPQAELFMIAHDLKRFQSYAATVTGEWPAPLAASFHGMLLTYDQTVRQFPRWRAFETNALKDRLSEPQVADAPAAAHEAAADFRSKESAELIDAAIPEAIDALADALGAAHDGATPSHPIEIGQDQLALDTLESINNVYKGIASAALKGWEFTAPERDAVRDGVSDGRRQVVKEIKKDTKAAYVGAYHWMRRHAKKGLVGGTAGAGLLLAGLPQRLIASYPSLFSWLEPVLRFFW